MSFGSVFLEEGSSERIEKFGRFLRYYGPLVSEAELGIQPFLNRIHELVNLPFVSSSSLFTFIQLGSKDQKHKTHILLNQQKMVSFRRPLIIRGIEKGLFLPQNEQ